MKHNKNTQKNDSRLDRRGFLKSSSAIAGSAVALGSLSIERGAFAQSSDTIKVALVGCGGGGALGDPGGHPMVYLKIGGGKDGGGEITCPYCSRRYVLAAGEQNAPA